MMRMLHVMRIAHLPKIAIVGILDVPTLQKRERASQIQFSLIKRSTSYP